MKLRLDFGSRLAALRWRPDAALVQRALTLAAFLLLCWTLSGLLATLTGWRSSEPALSLPATPAEDSASGRRALLRWFSAPEAAPETAQLAGMQLLAVIAGHQGVALISGIEATPVAVQVGQEAWPGLRLQQVLPDKAIFEQAGARRELAFAESIEATAARVLGPDASASAPPAPQVKAVDLPAKTNTQSQKTSVSRGRLASIARDGNLGSWDKGLAVFSDGGIRIESASEQPLAQVLKLRNGDILRQINQREIRQLADISLVYHYFSQSQAVDLQILRDGKPLLLKFTIQP